MWTGHNRSVTEHEMFSDTDSVPLNLGHLKVWFTAGMGFFTDAYDLFIIGIVLILLEGNFGTSFRVSAGNPYFGAGLLASSAIIAAVFGQLTFGRLADLLGRKRVYGIEAAILAIGAILSAFATSYTELLIFRFILGFGIGGDYPVSATIMSEYSNKKDRGKLLSLVFANQGIGSVVAVAIGIISVSIFAPEMAWRFMLGFGAIPALAVLYMRRKLPETPRYSALVKGNSEEAKKAMKVTNPNADLKVGGIASLTSLGSFLTNYGKMLVVTAGSWFLLDMAFYGTGLYSGAITGQFISSSTLVGEVVLAGLPFIVGFFGYFTAVGAMDRLGRKRIQIVGRSVMAVIYLTLASVMVTNGSKLTGFTIAPGLALILYSLSFFFIDFGPNTTTFVVPAELYPVKFRTTGHGISAAMGKVGAAITTFTFAGLLVAYGIKPLMIMLAVTSLGGMALSLFLKETKDVSLEEASDEAITEVNSVPAGNASK